MTWHDATTTKPPVGERVTVYMPDCDEHYHVAFWDGRQWGMACVTRVFVGPKSVASWREIPPPPKRDKGLELVEALAVAARTLGVSLTVGGTVEEYDEAKTALLAYIRELEGKCRT